MALVMYRANAPGFRGAVATPLQLFLGSVVISRDIRRFRRRAGSVVNGSAPGSLDGPS